MKIWKDCNFGWDRVRKRVWRRVLRSSQVFPVLRVLLSVSDWKSYEIYMKLFSMKNTENWSCRRRWRRLRFALYGGGMSLRSLRERGRRSFASEWSRVTLETQEPGSKKPFLCYLVFPWDRGLGRVLAPLHAPEYTRFGVGKSPSLQLFQNFLKKRWFWSISRGPERLEIFQLFSLFLSKKHTFLSIPTTCKT